MTSDHSHIRAEQLHGESDCDETGHYKVAHIRHYPSRHFSVGLIKYKSSLSTYNDDVDLDLMLRVWNISRLGIRFPAVGGAIPDLV